MTDLDVYLHSATSPPVKAGRGIFLEGAVAGPTMLASHYSADLAPENAGDGDPNTYWSAETETDGGWIRRDLGSEMSVGTIRILWHRQDERAYYGTLEVSNDPDAANAGVAVWRGPFPQAGDLNTYQEYTFPPVSGRYIILRGNGNSGSTFTSVREFEANINVVSSPPGKPEALATPGDGSVVLNGQIESGPSASSFDWRVDGSDLITGLSSPSHIDSPVTNDIERTYVLRAHNADGFTDSDPVAVTPTAGGGGTEPPPAEWDLVRSWYEQSQSNPNFVAEPLVDGKIPNVNVGSRIPYANMTVHANGLTINTPGTYTGLDIQGTLTINVEDVTIEDSRIRTAAWDGTGDPPTNHPVFGDTAGITIRYCEIDAAQGDRDCLILRSTQSKPTIVEYCDIYHGVDTFKTRGEYGIFRYNWAHHNGKWQALWDWYTANGKNVPHADGLQQGLGIGWHIYRNWIAMGGVATAFMYSNLSGELRDFIIEENYLNANNQFGQADDKGTKTSAPAPSGWQVINNKCGRMVNLQAFLIDGTGHTETGNVFFDDGTPVPDSGRGDQGWGSSGDRTEQDGVFAGDHGDSVSYPAVGSAFE